LSEIKTVFVLTTNDFFKLQNLRVVYCIRCQEPFEENNIITTSATNHRYCYKCTAKINLVSENTTKDLQLDIAFKETNNHIKKKSKKIHLDKSIVILTKETTKEYFTRSLIHLKNIFGLACASIYHATIPSEKDKIENIIGKLPVNFRIIQEKFLTLRWFLTNSKLLGGLDGNFM